MKKVRYISPKILKEMAAFPKDEHRSVMIMKRSSHIPPQVLENSTLYIHNGKGYLKIGLSYNSTYVSKLKLGELALTRAIASHTKKKKKK